MKMIRGQRQILPYQYKMMTLLYPDNVGCKTLFNADSAS